MLADTAVVSDLHEIVDLRAGADSRAAGLGAIDACVRTNLHIVFQHDVADLEFVPIGRRQKPSRIRRCR